MNLQGNVYGDVTVIREVGRNRYGILWECKCKCGRTFDAVATALNSGRIARCPKSRMRLNLTEIEKPIYSAWSNIKNRCLNQNSGDYRYYGGRGITICPEWSHSFDAFYNWAKENGWEKGLTIDRIDVNGNYCPENCRWVDMKHQCNNRTNNHMIEFNGEIHTLQEWADILGISHDVIKMRLRRGWTIERTLTEKVHTREDFKRIITIDGISGTVGYWSEQSGVPVVTINNRLWKGWDERKAIFQPHK